MKILRISLLLLFTFISTVSWADSPLSNLAGEEEEEFLDPDVAFVVTATQGDGNTIKTNWLIQDGYYLYKDKISVAPADESQLTLGNLPLPKGKEKEDEYFGLIVSIDHEFNAEIPITTLAANASSVDLIFKYQGCAKAGLCYPPITKNITVNLDSSGGAAAAGSTSGGSANTTSGGSGSGAEFTSEQDKIASTLANGSFWSTIAIFFGLGLLLAFTPCVFPMIPILSSIIVGQGKNLSTSKAFTLSLVYVLAMAVTYTLAGMGAGYYGENVQIWFQNPWVLSVFAGIFVLLSLAMFGFYELQMPSSIQSKLNNLSSSQDGGTYIGAGIMGFLSALIVGPCVTAPLIGALLYISSTKDYVLGGSALFALSMGMGAPLLAIGTSAGKLLPKAGAWMDTVKGVFGVLLLGLGIWMLDRILPASIILLMTGALLIVSAIYMGAWDAIKEGANGWSKFSKGLGLIAFVYGAILVIGAASGGTSLLQPLQKISANNVQMVNTTISPSSNDTKTFKFEYFKSVEDLDAQIAKASAEGKPVLVDFYADWCIYCKQLDRETFPNSNVQAALQDFVLLKADVTDNDNIDKELLKKLGLIGPPALLFYDTSGNEHRNFRIITFVDAEKLVSHISLFKESGLVAQK
ncbi:MAG: protein-disulfide reductase DsbD [Gammaproteobacteria bacterium]|nr:MAG: protein-disulfide reductase DsbD [Gammaproteobacteria bacterium]